MCFLYNDHKFHENFNPTLLFFFEPTSPLSLLSRGTSAPKATVSWLLSFLSRNKVSR